jgi:CRISPR-associated protein Csy2
MEISLIIAVRDYFSPNDGKNFAEDVMAVVQGMRLAGGSILPMRDGNRFAAQWWPLAEDRHGQSEMFRKFRRRLLPGFALVQREDRLLERLNELRADNPTAHALDALLDLSRLNIEPDTPDPATPDLHPWRVRSKPGWLVPLPIGYSALSPLYPPGDVENARDEVTSFRFVESLYSLGEWISPHRLTELQQLLWHPQADTENGVYCCINGYSDVLKTTTAGIA